MKRSFSRAFTFFVRLMLALLTAGILMSPGQSAAQSLTDAQAQILIQKAVAAQANPSTPQLTPAENQALVQYLLFRNQQGAAASFVSPGVQQLSPVQAIALQRQHIQPGISVVGMGNSSSMAFANTQAPSQAPVVLGPKRPGVVRIGVVMPKAQLGQGAQGPQIGEPVRTIISQYLTGPNLEITPIVALIPQQIDAEAKEKQCDYLVITSITQKKSSGFGLLKGATTVASMMPMVAMAKGASSAMAAASAANSAAIAAERSKVSGAIKAKSDVQFDYQLQVPGSTSPLVSEP